MTTPCWFGLGSLGMGWFYGFRYDLIENPLIIGVMLVSWIVWAGWCLFTSLVCEKKGSK